MQTVRLQVNQVGQGEVTIDGQVIHGVRAITVTARAGQQATHVVLELVANVEVHSEITEVEMRTGG